MATSVLDRIERLSTASARRVIEPDADVAGELGAGQLIPDELLLTAGLDADLGADVRRALAVEQTAAMLEGGIRLEAILLTGFGRFIADHPDVTDPRVTYLLHELGEETRHSRLFIRVLEQLGSTATNPFRTGLNARVGRRVVRLSISSPAMLCTMVLAGEEIPDLIQRRLIDHPDTDPYLRRVSQYHRQEEARHIGFARILVPEVWATATRRDRFLVRRVAPVIIGLLLETQLLHPGIYEAAGLPGRRTWRAVHRTDHYRQLRIEACRPLLQALPFRDRVPRGWRRLCGVDRAGQPV